MLQCIVKPAAGAWLNRSLRGGKVLSGPLVFSDTVRAYQPNAASARRTLVLPATRN
jgi:hypothetical protein